jgi:hypothetical protein
MSNSEFFDNCMMVSRAESPAVEHLFQGECQRVIKQLLETKGLYQNVRVNESIFDSYGLEFLREFKKRPIAPQSRGDGDAHPSPFSMSGLTQTLETPHDQMEAAFYLPSVNLECLQCSRASTFLSMSCSVRNVFLDPYPLIGNETEQVINLYYRCATCRSRYIVFQVFRKGFKFQLTGRSTPFRPAIAREWPANISQIIQDAYVAAAENDIPAAYYHLRTAAEFYLKAELGLLVSERIEGSELCERYNVTIDNRLKSGFPSFGTMYAELSAGLHTREVSSEQFTKLSSDFLAHLQAKALFAQYSAT